MYTGLLLCSHSKSAGDVLGGCFHMHVTGFICASLETK